MRAIIFDAIDTNHDGRVTKEEAGLVLVPVKQGANSKATDKATKRRDALLVKLDLAKPEGVPKDEFIDRDTALFATADKNKDGKIDRAEFVTLLSGFGVLLPQ